MQCAVIKTNVPKHPQCQNIEFLYLEYIFLIIENELVRSAHILTHKITDVC